MYPTSALREIANGLKTTMNANPVTIRLFQNDVALTPDMVIADFTEATFEGYAAANPTSVGVAWDDEFGNGVFSFESVHFQGTTGVTPNTIYGWYMTATLQTGGPAVFTQAVRFDTPIPILGAVDAIDFVPLVKIGQPLE